MSAVIQYVSHLVVLLILTTFLERVLPSQRASRYIRFAFGFVVLLALLRPLYSIVTNPWQTENAIVHAFDFNGSGLSQSRSQTVVLSMKQDLAKSIALSVYASTGVTLIDPIIIMNTSPSGSTMVTGVRAMVAANGRANPKVLMQAIRSQIAIQLGLSPNDVTILVAGG
jgi:stage III sporulation protein AF